MVTQKKRFQCSFEHSKKMLKTDGRPPDKSAYWKIIFLISQPKHGVGTQ